MKFLKTHTGAMVVLAVVIVLSVLLGSHRSLVQAREKVEAQFAPIAGDLQDCLDITATVSRLAVMSRQSWRSPPTCSPWRGGTWTRVSWVS